jgi:hypothetical protein
MRPDRAVLLTALSLAAAAPRPAAAEGPRFIDLGLQLGWNAPHGLGIGVGVRPLPQFDVVAGVGVGLHGIRLGLHTHYFFSPENNSGFAGVGYNFNSGLGTAPFSIITTGGQTTTANFNLAATHVINLVAGWRFGFADDWGQLKLFAGWGIRVTPAYIPVGPIPDESDASKIARDIVAPGGLILGLEIGGAFGQSPFSLGGGT